MLFIQLHVTIIALLFSVLNIAVAVILPACCCCCCLLRLLLPQPQPWKYDYMSSWSHGVSGVITVLGSAATLVWLDISYLCTCMITCVWYVLLYPVSRVWLPVFDMVWYIQPAEYNYLVWYGLVYFVLPRRDLVKRKRRWDTRPF